MSQLPVDRRGAAAAMQLGWIWKDCFFVFFVFCFVLFFVCDFVPFVPVCSRDKHVGCSKVVLSSIQVSLQADLDFKSDKVVISTKRRKKLRMDLPFGHALARDGSGSTSLA